MKYLSLILASLIVLGVCVLVGAQEKAGGGTYYYCGHEKILLKMSTRFLVVQVKEGVDNRKFARKLMRKYTSEDSRPKWPKAKSFSVPSHKTSFCIGTSAGVLDEPKMRKTIEETRKMLEVKYAGPTYFSVEDVRERLLIVLDEFIVKFGNNVKKEEIDRVNIKFGVEVVKMFSGLGNTYVLRVKEPNKINALEMANKYIEISGVEIEYAKPNSAMFLLK